MTTPSTYIDWNPERVDLLTMRGIVRHFGIPRAQVRRSIRYDPKFPPFRRDWLGRKRYRQPDLVEYFEGARG